MRPTNINLLMIGLVCQVAVARVTDLGLSRRAIDNDTTSDDIDLQPFVKDGVLNETSTSNVSSTTPLKGTLTLPDEQFHFERDGFEFVGTLTDDDLRPYASSLASQIQQYLAELQEFGPSPEKVVHKVNPSYYKDIKTSLVLDGWRGWRGGDLISMLSTLEFYFSAKPRISGIEVTAVDTATGASAFYKVEKVEYHRLSFRIPDEMGQISARSDTIQVWIYPADDVPAAKMLRLLDWAKTWAAQSGPDKSLPNGFKKTFNNHWSVLQLSTVRPSSTHSTTVTYAQVADVLQRLPGIVRHEPDGGYACFHGALYDWQGRERFNFHLSKWVVTTSSPEGEESTPMNVTEITAS